MAFPTTPTNGEIYVDPVTKRTWFYESAISSWRVLERETLGEYTTTDVVSTPPVDEDILAYDAVGAHFQNESSLLGKFDGLYDGNAIAPTSNDQAEAGEVWRDSTAEKAYLCVTYTPPSTATVIDVPAIAFGSLVVNAGERIAQSFEITTAGVYNRFTLYFGTTDTFNFTLNIYSGTDVDATPIMTQTFLGVGVSPGPELFSFTDTFLSAGTYSWAIESLAGNNPVAVRRSADTTYTNGSPVTGTNVVHSLVLLGSNLDWGFQFGYDIPTGVAEWLPVDDPLTYTQRVWRSAVPPPVTPFTDGLLWHDTTVGITFMWDIDALVWVQL